MPIPMLARPLGLAAAIAVFAFGPLAAPAHAGEADDLAKQADKVLRHAERLMFSGKYDASKAELDNAAGLIAKLEEADPAHAKLTTLKRKNDKLAGDLERRMPKKKGDADKDSSGSDGEKATDKPAKLPYHASQRLTEFKRIQGRIDNAYRMIEQSKIMKLSKSVDDYYADINTLIDELKTTLAEARKLAAEKGVDGHAELDAAQTYIDAAPQQLTKVKADMAKFAKEQAAREAAEAAAAEAVASEQEAAKQAQVPQAQADWKALAALSKEYQDTFVSESEMKKKGAVVQKAWTDWKRRFEPVRKRFRERYGDNSPKVYEAFEGVPKPEGVAMDAPQAANIAYDVDFAQCEKRFADWAAQWGASALGLAARIEKDNTEKIELKYTRAEDAIRYFKIARDWSSGADYASQIAEAEKIATETLPLWKKVLQEMKWPGHNAEFAGPGAPEDIAAAALAFLREHPEWSAPEYDDEHTPYAACVEGKGWEVWKRAPLTQEPTQYSIDVLVAFTGKADADLVYVYHMVFYTAEHAGVEPGLPIHYGSSKQYAKFRMLTETVPQAD